MFDTAVNLCVEDISLFTDYVILRLKESKTDPFRKGIDIKLFKIDGPICPFSAFKKYFSVSKTKFVTDSHQALSRQYFLGKLKFILQLCGYDPTLYNGHSFRSSTATSAGKALVEDHMINILGR